MTAKIADRVKETTTTTGTGTLNLDGAVPGFQTFVAGIGTGNSCYYCVTGGSEWEVGIGTVTDATPDTLSRTTILASSNAGSVVTLSAGTKDVFCTAAAASVGGAIKVAQVVASGSQSTIHFASIPGNYTDLVLAFWGRDTGTGAQSYQQFLKFNSDATAANYASMYYYGTAGSGTVAATTSGTCAFWSVGTGNNANAIAVAEVRIHGYASTSFHKMFNGQSSTLYSSGPTRELHMVSGVWKSTAAITDIVISTVGTAYADGTIATLYGLA